MVLYYGCYTYCDGKLLLDGLSGCGGVVGVVKL